MKTLEVKIEGKGKFQIRIDNGDLDTLLNVIYAFEIRGKEKTFQQKSGKYYKIDKCATRKKN